MSAPPPFLAPRPAVGARVGPGGVDYRVWAPTHAHLRVRIRHKGGGEAVLNLTPTPDGYHAGRDPGGRDGDLYWFEFTDGSRAPDPTSRFQPEGVHGPSECIDPSRYRWRCGRWRRPAWGNHVIYELHVGTFTAAGTYRAAIDRLDHVRALGATAIELMPLADFAGERNWGYDGVALYAPARCYGRPDDLRELVDSAHERGLAVILDVVYNHFGPEGNHLPRYSPRYFHEHHTTPWGQGFNLDGLNSGPVRAFFIGNAAYWMDDFRFDGLRLDATHAIRDDSPRHLLVEIAEAVHARGGFVTAEDERNAVELVVPTAAGGLGLDAAWSDDFHHQVRVALTGTRRSYFSGYAGTAEEIARTLANGWFYTGQPFPAWQGRPRGSDPRAQPTTAFITCLENHDQVGNLPRGERLEHLVDGSAFRAASMLLCLSPYPPLLFMGQEWAASSPFQYFTDHPGDLGRQVSEGRRREFKDFSGGDGPLPDPQDPATFQRSKLLWEEIAAPAHARVLELYRACLRERAAWLHQATDRRYWEVRALGEAVALRYRPPGGPERLLVVVLRGSEPLAWASEAWLRPPGRTTWTQTLHSNLDAPESGQTPFAVLFTAQPA